MSTDDTQKRIDEIESQMSDASFWNDQERSQEAMQELNQLKSKLAKQKSEEVTYDDRNAILTIFAGAGGDDAEDFARILFDMYVNYIEKEGWAYSIMHQHENEHDGFKNVTIEIQAKRSPLGAYGALKNESGVHRLVRISPFNANKQRHTSFAMVEVIPKFDKISEIKIPEDDIQVEFAKSSGPGGQNVNKRETAVRMTHTPTGISVHVDSERSQHANREQAYQLLAGRIHRRLEEERKSKEEGMYVSKTTDAEWGSQIRSYVFHPYQQVKDHRTNVTVQEVDSVLEGEIDPFLEAERTI